MSTVIETPEVGVIMGSRSDWETMQAAVKVLTDFEVPYESQIVSAHRTPERMVQYAQTAERRGLKVLIAGAGGAAHLPGMVAALTTLPVLGVPVQSKALSGLDSLLSIVQMPGGVPVGTMAIGVAGAKNAGLLAIRILATQRNDLRTKLQQHRQEQSERVRNESLPDLD
jgi:5-(carboxyamino)imidazole ribonucleotide mutase